MPEIESAYEVRSLGRARRLRMAVAAAVVMAASAVSMGIAWAEGCSCG